MYVRMLKDIDLIIKCVDARTCVPLAHKRELWDSSNDKSTFIEQLRYNAHCSLHTFSCLIFRVTLLGHCITPLFTNEKTGLRDIK